MASQSLAEVLRFLRNLAGDNHLDEQSDSHLLQRFVGGRDEDAFAALLLRHGPLVFGVCRQVLRDGPDAEDAFQATFLVLARKAATVRRHESLAAWLHRVALNIARTAKAGAAQRQAHERQAGLMPRTTPVDDVAPRDWEPLIHEEVDRLPEKYRVPVVLCYLEGLTHDEAARQLGWPLGTVKGRLARARDLLRTRLVRRGLTLSGGALAAALAQGAAQGYVPTALLGSTLRASVSFAGGVAIPAGAASAQAVTLAKGALQTMTTTKLVPVLVLLLALGAVGFAATLGHGLGRETTPVAPLVTEEGARPAPEKNGEAPRAEPRAKDEEPAKPAEAEPVNGLKLTLRLDKTETRLRADGSDIEPVNLRFTYANVSDRPIKLDLTVAAALAGTRLEVDGPGVWKFAEKRPANQPDQLIAEDFRVLKPGAEWSIELSFPLYIFFWDLFMVKQPGDYHIKAVHALDKETDSPLAKGSWTGTVTSNEVVLKVLPSDGFGEEVKGLRAAVSLAKQKFVVGEAVAVQYVVKNVSKEEQTLWHCGFWPNHQVFVNNAEGIHPPLTEFGRQCEKSFAPGGERGKNAPVKVPAGGEDAAYEEYDLTKLYDLSKPGRYTVQYVYEEKQGGWEGRLPSNVAAFEVIAGEEKKEDLAESAPVRVEGLSFVALVPKRVAVPPPGGTRDVALGLRVTNVSDKPLALGTFDVIRPRLHVVSGLRVAGIKMDAGRDGKPRPTPPATLAPGASWTWQPQAKLSWPKDDKGLLLSGPDGRGVAGFWSFRPPGEGKYRLAVDYANNNAKQDDVSLWVGKATTNEVEFEIVAPETPPGETAAPPGVASPTRGGQKFEGEIDGKDERGEGHLQGYRVVVPVTLKAGANVSASVTVVGRQRAVGLMLKDPTGKILGSSKMVSGAARIGVEEVNANGNYTIEVYSDRIGPYTLWVADTADELDKKELEVKIDRLEKELAALREKLKAMEKKP